MAFDWQSIFTDGFNGWTTFNTVKGLKSYLKENFAPFTKPTTIVDSVSSGTADDVTARPGISSLFLGSGSKGNKQVGSNDNDAFYGNRGDNEMSGNGGSDSYLLDRRTTKTTISEKLNHRGVDSVYLARGINKDDLTFIKVDKNHLKMLISNDSEYGEHTDIEVNFIATKNSDESAGKGKMNSSWFGVEKIIFADGSYLTPKKIDKILTKKSACLAIKAGEVAGNPKETLSYQIPHTLPDDNHIKEISIKNDAYVENPSHIIDAMAMLPEPRAPYFDSSSGFTIPHSELSLVAVNI